MMDPSESLEEIDRLVECYIEEHRAGHGDSIDEFISRHPQWAQQLNELLPAVSVLEYSHSASIARAKALLPDIPNYRFSHELGRGGMGVVYQAEHVALERQVAIKVLSASRLQDAKAQEQFQREARATARMHHSNIVPVFEVGHHNGTSYYSMPLIVGKNLNQHIQALTGVEGPASDSAENQQHYRRVAVLGISIARALHYAHQRNVLHRDIKPSNILIDDNNTAWLSDFGLASISDESVALSDDLVGTLRYLAPERLQGKCDERSDIYSLGLTLYEYLILSPACGSLQTTDLINLSRKIQRIRQRAPEIPADLATIIEKAIHHEPTARFNSAEELAIDLQNFLDGKPISARPVSSLERIWLWGKRNPSIATLALSLNLVLLAVAVGSTAIAARLRDLNRDANHARSQAIVARELAQVHAVEAEQHANIAEKNEKSARHVSGYFARMIQCADPSGLFTGRDRPVFPIDQSTTAFEWIAQSAKLLEAEDFSDAPLVEAELKDTLGVALTAQMRMDEAAPLLKRGLEIRSKLLDANDPEIAKSLDHLGTFSFYAGDPQTACDYFSKALAIRELRIAHLTSEALNDDLMKEARLAKARTQSALGLASEYSSQNANPVANELLRESLATRIELLGADHEEVAYCQVAHASILARQIKPEQAMEAIQKAEKILTKSQGDHRLSEVFSLYAQGTALQYAQMTDLSIDRFSRAEALMTELFGPNHPLVVYARGEVAGVLERSGHPEKAEAIYKRVIDFNQKAMAKQPFLGQSWDTLGICYRGQNKIPEATDAFENALRIFDECGLPLEHILVAKTKKRLADCLVILGRIDEAYVMLKEATEALELQPKEIIDTDLATGLSYMSYLTLWNKIDKYPEVVDAVVRVGKDELDPRVIDHLMNAGTRGHCTLEQAETLMVMNDRWITIAKDDYSQLEAAHFRGRILWQRGQYDEAINVLQGKQRCERRRFQADLFISLCWKAKGDLAKAELLFLEAVDRIMPRLPGHFAVALRNQTTERITYNTAEVDPASPIEFPWEQTAYGQFAWRLLHE